MEVTGWAPELADHPCRLAMYKSASNHPCNLRWQTRRDHLRCRVIHARQGRQRSCVLVEGGCPPTLHQGLCRRLKVDWTGGMLRDIILATTEDPGA